MNGKNEQFLSPRLFDISYLLNLPNLIFEIFYYFSHLNIVEKIEIYSRIAMNPCAVPTEIKDIDGDNRWMSIVSQLQQTTNTGD